MKRIMKMPSHIRLIVLLSIVSVHILGDAVCPSRLYQILFNGGQKLAAPYVQFNTTNAIHCSSTCNANPSCWIYTWDTETKECGLLQSLSWPVTTVAAPPSLRTHYIKGMNGKVLDRTSIKGYWSIVKTECEGIGGRLHMPPDSTYSRLIHYLLGEEKLWVGMSRKPTDDMYTWFDMDGNPAVTKMEWRPKNPNNAGGDQFYMATWNGTMNDDGTIYIYYGLCDVPRCVNWLC
ncbi:uncharacterized protein LOC135214545 [Macrobrachium nipponense]|uniref:uncharacterized protein LOC135214545 n=1 Tax=Macrobrachium nipponense TaxID=159736 RepID=UPI0030C84560